MLSNAKSRFFGAGYDTIRGLEKIATFLSTILLAEKE